MFAAVSDIMASCCAGSSMVAFTTTFLMKTSTRSSLYTEKMNFSKHVNLRGSKWSTKGPARDASG